MDTKMNTKVYCKNCTRWYKALDLNQCNIPDGGLHLIKDKTPSKNELAFLVAKGDLDMDQIRFINKKLSSIGRSIVEPDKFYGTPSELNNENNCIFYQGKDREKESSDLKVKFLNSFPDMLMFMAIILLVINMLK